MTFCEFAGNHEPLSSVTMPVATGKENLAESAEAIMAQAKKLGPLLSRAEEVLRRHQERKGALSFQSGEAIAPHRMGTTCAPESGKV